MRTSIPLFEGLTAAVVLLTMLPQTVYADPKKGEPDRSLAQLRVLRAKKIGEYFKGADSTEARTRLASDLEFVRTEGQSLGVFQPSLAFEKWWRLNPLTDDQIRQLDQVPVTAAVNILYLRYANDHASDIDREAKLVRKPGVPTKGDEDFADKVEASQHSSIGRWFTSGGAWLGAASLIAGGVILKKIDDVFFFGTLTQLTNVAFEPIIRPVREKIDQISNTYLAPRTIGWSRFVNGEDRRRANAVAKARSGTALTGEAARFEHPAISVEDFAKDHADFYNEFMKADYRWRGWMPAEYIRARNTGFELLYAQWTSLAERISAYESNANNIVVRIATVSRPELKEAGATAAELDRFVALLNEKQELLVFKSLSDPGIPIVDGKLTEIVHSWQDRGIASEKIEDLYQLTIDAFVAKTRPSFGLAAMLDNERYFQENNIALKGLDKIQAWQEQAREMVGYYEALQKYSDPIEKFYARKGLNYDLKARIAERGYPLGGAPRPAHVPLVKTCKDLFKALPL